SLPLFLSFSSKGLLASSSFPDPSSGASYPLSRIHHSAPFFCHHHPHHLLYYQRYHHLHHYHHHLRPHRLPRFPVNEVDWCVRRCLMYSAPIEKKKVRERKRKRMKVREKAKW